MKAEDRKDCLFIHCPKFSNWYAPFGEFMSILYMPMGLMGLADVARNAGYSSEVVHLGVEWIVTNQKGGEPFEIVEYVRKHRPMLVALPLFWHYQIWDTIEVAKQIKAAVPETFILLGGYTASIFPDEIFDNFDAIDGIVQGHGEEPLRKLLAALRDGRDPEQMAQVPNLAWRCGGQAIYNEARWVATDADVDQFRTSDLSLLRNRDVYIEISGFPLVWMKHAPHAMNRRVASRTSLFPLFVGRGCSVSCSWCGGGKGGHRKFNFSNHVLWQRPEKVVETIREALSFGYDGMYVCFDPKPKEDYFPRLFRLLQEEDLSPHFYFECWSLPTEEFVAEFAKAFPGDKGTIALSPESGSAKVRRRNKGFKYSDEELFDAMDMLERYQVNFDLFFSVGMPFETEHDVPLTRDMIAKARDLYAYLRWVLVMPMQMEPGSPMFNRPDKFGITTDRRSLMDFYDAHSRMDSDPYTCLGYASPNFFDDGSGADQKVFEQRIKALRCKYFCLLESNEPQYNSLRGRSKCKVLESMWKVRSIGNDKRAEPVVMPAAPAQDPQPRYSRVRGSLRRLRRQ